MSDASLESHLCSRFGDTLSSDGSLMAECVGMCQIFNLSPEDLFFKWEAFKFGGSRTQVFDAKAARDLKEQIQRDMQAEAAKRQAAQNRAKISGMMSKGRGSGSAVFGPRRMDLMGSTVVKSEPGTVHTRSAVAGPSKVNYVGQPKERMTDQNYRYMYEKVTERSEVLDHRIDEFAELVVEHYKVSELGDPASATEEDIFVVGRIVLDSEFASSGSVKLNEASLMLESSRTMGSGTRVPIRFDADLKVRGGLRGAGGAGLFPGAIVALKGRNGGGGWFGVSEILALPPLRQAVCEDSAKTETVAPFAMVAASGPFTLESDLKFRPWQQLIGKLKSSKPAVVLLCGPFVDSAHPHIKAGAVDETPTEIFSKIFADSLREFLDLSPGSIVLLVPHVRDTISAQAVFPQGPFTRVILDDPRIHFLPNPSRFTLNGISFGVTSVDVLFHLRKEEFFKRSSAETDSIGENQASDAMVNLCNHLVQQRSFYPLFPVPLELSSDVNLDVSHGMELYMGADAPDVLLLPSRLKHFEKIVNHCTTVNPGYLTKGIYASIKCEGFPRGRSREGITVVMTKLDAES